MHAEADDEGARWGGSRMLVWGAAALLLLIPAVAMRFTAEVQWTGGDFAVVGTLLLAACGAFEIGARLARSRTYLSGVVLAVVAALALVWVNLAVGLLGGEGNAANLMFVAVIAVGVVGAVLTRGRTTGMSAAMAATAGAQALACTTAVAAGWASPGMRGVYEAAVGTILFGGLWLTAAWLFRSAARAERVAAVCR